MSTKTVEFIKVSELSDLLKPIVNQLSELFRNDYKRFIEFEIQVDTESGIFVFSGDFSVSSFDEIEMMNINPNPDKTYIQFADFEVDFRKEYLTELEDLLNGCNL